MRKGLQATFKKLRPAVLNNLPLIQAMATIEGNKSVLGKRDVGNLCEDKVDEPQCKKQKQNKDQCIEWLPKKRRQCKHALVAGTKYCRFHLPKESNSAIEGSKCEYCKTWILKKKRMSRHYKVCPVKLNLDKAMNEAFYSENIHFYGDVLEENEQKSESEFNSKELIERIKKCKNELTKIEDLSKDCSFSQIRALYSEKHQKKSNLKHCQQIESLILNLLQFVKFEVSKPTILELGAGKATFGSMLHSFFNEESKLFLIDILSNFRHKEDCALKKVENVRRIQCALQHCDLTKISGIDGDSQIFAISKHLCGAATDFGLRCVLNSKMNVRTICIALCCRGKCGFDSFCNLKYLQSAIGICSKREFEAFRAMSSWAIDGRVDDEEHTKIGKMCQSLIDEARVQFLKQNGFKRVKLVKYIDESVTKENILLLASRD